MTHFEEYNRDDRFTEQSSSSRINFCDIAGTHDQPQSWRSNESRNCRNTNSSDNEVLDRKDGNYSLYFHDALSGAAREDHLRVDLLDARSKYGPNSMQVAEALIRLGDSCESQSKSSESENYYRQAAAISQKHPENFEAGGLLLSLSERAQKHGKYAEAERWDKAGWTILNKTEVPYF